MTYPSDLKAALLDHLGRDWLVFMPNWTKSYHGQWASGKPKAILVHHSAAAATTSVNPKAPGNQKGANANVINYIQNHPLGCPAANFSQGWHGLRPCRASDLPCWRRNVPG
jgi:hypothetical protein